METESIGQIIAILILVVFSGYFSSAETAFTSLNRIRLKSKAEAGDKKAAATLALSEDFDRLLSTILVGNNVVNIATTALSTMLFVDLLDPSRGPIVATIVVTIVVLIFGEISPKSLAKEYPEKVATFCTPFLRFLMVILVPVTYLAAQWKGILNKIFSKGEDEGITEEELITMVSEAESEGGLDEHESELIRSAIEFNDLEVAEILVPRVDIIAVSDTATMEEVSHAFTEHGYSRLPVYHESVDNITGVLHEKNFHAALADGVTDVNDMATAAMYTTPTTKISDLLRDLQRAKTHMVIVADEYGGTEGLCTIEDIVEELVGEIWDEHDEVVESFQKLEDGSYLIACSANLTDLYEEFSIKKEPEFNTISGWVVKEVGRVPEEGDTFTYENLQVTVTRMDHRRVIEISVVVESEEPQEEEGSDDE